MNKETRAFVDDLFQVMKKHGVSIDCYCGGVDFTGVQDKDGHYDIYIGTHEVEVEWFRRFNESVKK